MKKTIALSLLFALALPALANEHEHHHDQASTQDAAGTEDEYVNAEVRKIDAENAKLTLKHEAIRKFQMAGMTMAFRVTDSAMLNTLAVGDKVGFMPDRVNGQYVITKIEKLQ